MCWPSACGDLLSFQVEINSLGALGWEPRVHMQMKEPFPPILKRGLAICPLRRGWASRTGANELAPWVGGVGLGTFKPHPGGPLASAGFGGQSPHPRPACLCRGLCGCPLNTLPAPCVWQVLRPSWTFMGKRPRRVWGSSCESLGVVWVFLRAHGGPGCLVLSLNLGTPAYWGSLGPCCCQLDSQ